MEDQMFAYLCSSLDCDFVGNCSNNIGSHLRGLPLYCCNSGKHDTMPHCNEVQPSSSTSSNVDLQQQIKDLKETVISNQILHDKFHE